MLPSKRQITSTSFTSPVCTTSGSVGTHELPLPPHSPPPSGLPLYFFEKMRYTRKRHLWRCSQVLRRGACKPLIPVFNSGHRLQPSNSCMSRSFLMPERKRRAYPHAIRIRPSVLQSFQKPMIPLNHCFPNSYSFGTGPYVFFLFCPGKNASRITAAMKITAIVRVAVSCEPRYCPPS